MNYSKLAKERDALGGISPELVQGQEGAGKTAGEGSCQKSAGVSTIRLTTSLPHSRRRRSSQGGEMNLWQRRLGCRTLSQLL